MLLCVSMAMLRVWAGSRAGLGCTGAAGAQQGGKKEGGHDKGSQAAAIQYLKG